ncbi:MAG: AAA family ATPase [Chloracidobacterium sp.]|nr:AAA family ATPase [Chloracidobacterium sp.]MDW8218679.1 AAA family ATPase [Acidobacteriota bacterium]
MTTAAALSETAPQRVLLNPDIKSPRAREFEEKLMARVVGQERAVRRLANLYQIYLAGLAQPGRPLGTLLFLGPTGSGKTRVVEAAAEALFGDPYAVVKIDCAEFQHSHEVAKLIGSPPGYLGHRETPPLLTQENLDKYHTEQDKLTFVLFDEIEKASDALWQLLLGILDKATLTLGDNRRVDFSKCLIVMTSNLGAKEMSELINGSIGFAPVRPETQRDDLDQKIYRTATEAARRKFSPEFMNRIDKVVVFRSLKEHHLERILELELNAVQERITRAASEKFVIRCSPETKRFLLDEGIDLKYGARHLKRAIERFLVNPIASLVATKQVRTGDLLLVDYDPEEKKLRFSKEHHGALVLSAGTESPAASVEQESLGGAAALPIHASPASVKTVSEN